RFHRLELRRSKWVHLEAAIVTDEKSAFSAEVDVDSARVLQLAHKFRIESRADSCKLTQRCRRVGILSGKHSRCRIGRFAGRLSPFENEHRCARAAERYGQ